MQNYIFRHILQSIKHMVNLFVFQLVTMQTIIRSIWNNHIHANCFQLLRVNCALNTMLSNLYILTLLLCNNPMIWILKMKKRRKGRSTISLNKFAEMFAHLRIFSVIYTNCHVNVYEECTHYWPQKEYIHLFHKYLLSILSARHVELNKIDKWPCPHRVSF